MVKHGAVEGRAVLQIIWGSYILQPGLANSSLWKLFVMHHKRRSRNLVDSLAPGSASLEC